MEDWDEILSREGAAIWRTAYRLLGNRADADECFQETFLGAVRLARRQELREPRAVLMRLATARAMDLLRRRYRLRKREATVEWDDRAAAQPSVEQLAEASELSENLRNALAELPTKQAEAFCLFGLEGWTYQQIADHFESSVDAVGVMLFRARAKLRQALSASQKVDQS